MKRIVLIILLSLYTFLNAQAQPEGRYIISVKHYSTKNERGHKARGGSWFNVKGVYPSSSNRTILINDVSLKDLDENQTRYNQGPTGTIEVPANTSTYLKELEINGAINVKNSNDADRSGTSYVSLENLYPCYDGYVSYGKDGLRILKVADLPSVFHVSIKPKEINLYYYTVGGSSNSGDMLLLPDKQNIAIKPTSGFPSSVFRWEYRIGISGAWTELTAFRYQPNLTFKGTDLPGVNFVNDVVRPKHKVQIRLNYGCGYSSIISLTPVISAPSIVSIDPVLETCHKSGDGKFIVTFDRQLYPGEYLEISAKTATGVPHTTHLPQNSSSLTLGGLPSGLYSTIRLVGTFPDAAYPTYTGDNSAHQGSKDLPERANITVSSLTSADVTCFGGEDGLIQLSLAGGTGKYIVGYPNNSYTDLFTENTPKQIAGLAAGIYPLTIRDENGCFPVDASMAEYIPSATIAQPAAPVQFGLADTLSPSGYKLTNGHITFNPATGGSGSYTYEWTKDGVLYTPSPGGTNAQNLGTGTYRITVKDSKYSLASPATEANCRGCYDTISFFLSQPDSLEVHIKIADSIKCYNGYGKLTAVASGGVKPYVSYRWEKWNGSTWQTESSVTSTLDNTSAGRYRVTITDSKNNQTLSPEFTLGQPNLLEITGFDKLDPLCYGSSDGWAEPIVTGGSAPYTYRWFESVPNPDTIRLKNLPKGSYDVRVTDRNGCTANSTVILDHPALLTTTEAITLPSAYNTADGAIQLTVNGGTQPYSYLWAHDSSTANPLTGIPANDNPYAVTVTDAHGCTIQAFPRVIYPIGVQVSVKDSILCSGDANGSLKAWAFGGVGASYQYEWFKVENGTPQSLNVYGNVLSDIGAGTYQVKATDIENNSSLSAEFIFSSPDLLDVTLTQYNLLCKYDTDGWVEAHPTGGTAPYAYQWSNGEVAKKIIGLEEDSYSLVMTDSRGCFVNTSTTITAPDELMLQIHYVEPLAYSYSDASVWVTATGGTAPYTYAWQGRTETVDSIGGIPHGLYTAIVTDANGCQKEISVAIPNPPLLEAFVSESRVISCNGRSDGQLTAASDGGVGSHRYTWYRREGSTLQQLSTGAILNNVPTGVYVVKVTDDNSIDAYSADFLLVQPDILQVSVTSNAIACNGDTDGWVKATATGGTSPYSYQWTSGHTTAEVNGLVDDKYFVFIVDSRGCEAQGQGEVTVPGGLVVDTTVVHPTCHNGTDGSISVQVSGGVAPYSYSWSDGSTGTSVSNLSPGGYSVTVTGANGCFKTVDIMLENPEAITIDLGPNRTLCIGQQAELDGTIADPAAEYRWLKDGAFFASTAKVLVSEAGTYTVVATSSKGCSGQCSILVQSNSSEIVANFAAPHKVARGIVTQLANANYPSPEKIKWLIPDDPNISVIRMDDEYADVIFLKNGTYTVGMLSMQGECEQVLYKQIEVVDSHEVPTEVEQQGEQLKQFIAYPIPNNGQFTAKVELESAVSIRLRLYDMSGNLIDDRTLTGQSSYSVSYDMALKRGLHILQLTTGKVNTSLKLIVQ